MAIRAIVARTAIIFAARSEPNAIVFCDTDAAYFRRRKRSVREAITYGRVASKATLECGDQSPHSTEHYSQQIIKAVTGHRTPKGLLDIELPHSQNPCVARNAVLEV